MACFPPQGREKQKTADLHQAGVPVPTGETFVYPSVTWEVRLSPPWHLGISTARLPCPSFRITPDSDCQISTVPKQSMKRVATISGNLRLCRPTIWALGPAKPVNGRHPTYRSHRRLSRGFFRSGQGDKIRSEHVYLVRQTVAEQLGAQSQIKFVLKSRARLVLQTAIE